MAEDPAHPWGSGETRYRWTAPVDAVVQRTLSRYPQLSANTYVCHPWCGWSKVSVDFWGPGGRGDPAPSRAAYSARRFLMNLPGWPEIRHTIIDHEIWTSWGGTSVWTRDDHTGNLRHLHVTYWPATAGA